MLEQWQRAGTSLFPVWTKGMCCEGQGLWGSGELGRILAEAPFTFLICRMGTTEMLRCRDNSHKEPKRARTL